MYAIIQTGGKQYRVSEGDYLRVEKLTAEPGDEIELDDVLLVGGEDGARVGAQGVKVKATVVDQAKGDKVIVFKFKRRKMYRRKRGHRQLFTGLRIDQIDLGDGQKAKKPAKKSEPTPKAEPSKKAAEAAAAPTATPEEKTAEAKPKKKPAPRKTPKAAAKKAAAPTKEKKEKKEAAPSGEAAAEDTGSKESAAGAEE